MSGHPSGGPVATILVATDGSEYSDGAVRVALAVAGRAGGRLLALSVAITNDEYEAVAAEAACDGDRRARALAEEVATRAAAAGLDCTPLVRRAQDPFEAICAAAAEHAADLVVMGRRGRRGLARMMVGDATGKVIGHAPCPVLVVPRAAAMWQSRLLLATDGSSSSQAAVAVTERLAACCGVPVTVLSVEAPGHSPERRAEAQPLVERTVEHLRRAGIEAEGMVTHGLPPDEILESAAEAKADVIVMGSHGRTGLGRLMIGSNSHAVIGRASCPVLVVKG